MNRPKTPGNWRRGWSFGAALATLTLSAGAASALTVVPVPQNPQDTTVPHAAYNGVPTTFKAIVRDGSPNYTVSFDYTGDGTYDYSYNTSNPYVLEASYTYPNVAVDTVYIAGIRVVDGAGNTAYGSYPVLISADVPSKSSANNATEDQLNVMRSHAIDEALWYIHKGMSSRGGSNNTITGWVEVSDDRHDLAASGAFIWALTLNGHIAAYPPGTIQGPLTADEEFQNNQMWNNTPYAEDAIRIINWMANYMRVQGGLNANEESDDGYPAIAGTNDGNGYYFYNNMYADGHATGGLAVATAPLGNTVVQTGVAQNQTWPFVAQQMVDFLIYAQNDGANNANGMGGFLYTAQTGNPGSSGADSSTFQWAGIGIESAYRAMVDRGVYVNHFFESRLANNLRFAQGNDGGVGYRNNYDDPAPTSAPSTFGGIKLTSGMIVAGGLLGWNNDDPNDPDGFACSGAFQAEQPYAPYANITRCQARGIYDGFKNYVTAGFTAHWSSGNYNSSTESNIYIYNIYSTQKAARSNVPEIETFGANDWFHQFSVSLIRTQRSTGGWYGFGPYSGTGHLNSYIGAGYGVLVLTQTLFNPKPEPVASVLPQTVTEGCAAGETGEVGLDHSGSFHPNPDADIALYQWDINASDGLWWDTGAAADYQTADRNQGFTHAYSDRGSYTVTLRVVDDLAPEPQVKLTSRVVTVEASNNQAPSANANGPYTMNDGDDLTLTGTGSDANVSCGDSIEAFWDIDGDGEYDDAVGFNPTIGAAALSGLARGVALPISLRVRDESGATTDSDTTLTIFNNRPVACFQVAPNRGSCGGVLTFDANCTSHLAPDGQIVSYAWDTDNDGQYDDSVDTVTQLTANAFGDLTISLQVTDGEGQTDTITQVVPVDQGNRAPSANANGPYEVVTSGNVTLSAAGSVELDGACGDSIVEYAWELDGDGDFNDGVTGAAPVVTGAQLLALGLQAADPDTGLPVYTISVRVTDSLGASNVNSTTLRIYGNDPVAIGLQDPEVGAIQPSGNAFVLFDGTRSYHQNPNRGIVSYAWDVDDNGVVDGNGASFNAVINFDPQPVEQVTRNIRLTVTDDQGNTATTLIPAAFKPPPTPPSVDADPDDDLPEDGYAIDLGQGVTFDGSNTVEPDAGDPFYDYIETVQWDIDSDGTYDYTFARQDFDFDGDVDADDPDPQMTLTLTAQDLADAGIDVPGEYTITMRAVDGFGLSSTDTTTLTVYGVDPVAVIDANTGVASCGQAVEFDAGQSYHQNPNRNIVSYSWDFDSDGNADSALESDSFAYPGFGTYTATLTVTDNLGTTDTETVEVVVSGGNQPPSAGIANGPFVINVGEDITVDGSASSDPNADCGDSVVRYDWDLDGDGFSELSTANAQDVVTWAQLTQAGNIQVANPSTGEPKLPVTLTVIDGQGSVGTVQTTLTVYGSNPVANASVDSNTVGCQTPVTFSTAGTYHQDPRRTINSYQWDVDYNAGVGFQADLVGQSPEYTFTEPGAHVVALRVTDNLGNTDIDTVTVNLAIQNRAPQADAGGPYTTAVINGNGIAIDLDASDSFDPNAPCDSIVEYAWDLTNNGQYDDAFGVRVEDFVDPAWQPGAQRLVRVRVTDESGLTAEASATIVVQSEPPPSITAVSPVGGARICAATTADFLVSDPEGDVVTVIATVAGQEIGRVDVDTPDNGDEIAGSINFDPGTLDDGDYLVTFTARDSGGGEAEDVTDGTFAVTCDSDADGDTVPDVEDNCPDDANLDQVDSDNDGLGDACDACAFDANNDRDGDGICGDVDNCPRHPNPDQVDDNGDGFGDACVNPNADLGNRGSFGPGSSIGDGSSVGNDSNIGADVDIGDNSNLGNASDVEDGAQIGDDVDAGRDFDVGENSVIGDGVQADNFVNVGDNSVIGDNVVLGQDSDVGDNSNLAGGDNPVVLNYNSQVGNNVDVGQGTVLGDGARIGDDSNVGEFVEMQPRASVGQGSEVGDGTVIRALTEIGDEATIGQDVTVGDQVEIGDRVSIGDRTEVAYSADIGNDFTVGTDSLVGGIIGNNVTMGNNADMRGRTTMGSDNSIGDDFTMRTLSSVGSGNTIGNGLNMGSRTSMGDNNVIGDNVVISYRAGIGNGVTLEDEVQINDATQVGDGSTIGARTRLYPGVQVGTNVTIGSDCIVRLRSTIGDNTSIADNTIIYEEMAIGANVTILNSNAPDFRHIGRQYGNGSIADGVTIDRDTVSFEDVQ